MRSEKLKVCIVGAGASGLAAVRQASLSECIEPIVFEKSSIVGGLWAYSDKTTDEFGEPIHSSMYASLRTHLPTQLMCYPDFPFKHSPKHSFLTHEDMITYLNDYAETYQLKNFIRFRHKVVDIQRINDADVDNCVGRNDACRWLVTVEDMDVGKTELLEFDSVVICNGHCFQPFIPSLKGLESFIGEVSHSRDYRRPEKYNGKNVLVIGGGLSALDITVEIASCANKVTFCHKGSPLNAEWMPQNVFEEEKVHEIHKSTVTFASGREFEYDFIVLCTGYEYSYPFLSNNCGVEVKQGKSVEPLYRHFINIQQPTMSFFGLPFLNAAFPLFECQAKFYVAFLEGKVTLPSKETMLGEARYEMELKRNNGLPISKTHSMENNPWDYYKTLGFEAGFDTSWISLLRSIYNQVNQRRELQPMSYKYDKILVTDETSYVMEYYEEITD